jgi:hypothetical protein
MAAVTSCANALLSLHVTMTVSSIYNVLNHLNGFVKLSLNGFITTFTCVGFDYSTSRKPEYDVVQFTLTYWLIINSSLLY